MQKVGKAMRNMDISNAVLRPTLSPTYPIKTPPIGRMRK
eukprot:CAMPEP_0116856788 /NCGR_PEP_ID=MMETSP0418-20121206/20137_1 /TAXON_ID=1158023 /ORGANISM="Astrosyne radiata, Strain 13vi08-1A" /LENGTH=38 /DNA_ID= /DNA_START= /DNA_END= /DNA_ORIENTATION=